MAAETATFAPEYVPLQDALHMSADETSGIRWAFRRGASNTSKTNYLQSGLGVLANNHDLHFALHGAGLSSAEVSLTTRFIPPEAEDTCKRYDPTAQHDGLPGSLEMLRSGNREMRELANVYIQPDYRLGNGPSGIVDVDYSKILKMAELNESAEGDSSEEQTAMILNAVVMRGLGNVVRARNKERGLPTKLLRSIGSMGGIMLIGAGVRHSMFEGDTTLNLTTAAAGLALTMSVEARTWYQRGRQDAQGPGRVARSPRAARKEVAAALSLAPLVKPLDA